MYFGYRRPLGKRIGFRGFGYWGQWIQSAKGSDAGSIEGGMFQDDKVGLTYYPKYHTGAAAASNPNSDTTGGWGFRERKISCKWMTKLVMTNSVVLPPNSLGFESSQDTHEMSGGIFVGSA